MAAGTKLPPFLLQQGYGIVQSATAKTANVKCLLKVQN